MNGAPDIARAVESPSPGAPVGREVGDRVSIRIGGHTLAFRAGDARVCFFLHHNHDAFRVADETPLDCELVWTIEPVTPSAGALVHSYERRWEIRRLDDGDEEITFSSAAPGDSVWRPTVQMVSDPEFRRVRVRQAPRSETERLAYVSEYPWAEYVMQRRLGLHGGAILHASMAVVDGEAHLFMGHSGAGKSTIAEIAEQAGAAIPTDDRTILTVAEDRPLAWGTPWHGSFRRTSPMSAPIASISLLAHSAEDRIDRIGVARAVQEMFVRTVQARVTAREAENTLETLERVARRVPCFALDFRPTPNAVRLVLDAVRSSRGGR
jgi:hypothetical protein